MSYAVHDGHTSNVICVILVYFTKSKEGVVLMFGALFALGRLLVVAPRHSYLEPPFQNQKYYEFSRSLVVAPHRS